MRVEPLPLLATAVECIILLHMALCSASPLGAHLSLLLDRAVPARPAVASQLAVRLLCCSIRVALLVPPSANYKSSRCLLSANYVVVPLLWKDTCQSFTSRICGVRMEAPPLFRHSSRSSRLLLLAHLQYVAAERTLVAVALMLRCSSSHSRSHRRAALSPALLAIRVGTVQCAASRHALAFAERPVGVASTCHCSRSTSTLL
jgi:hypothetical protein